MFSSLPSASKIYVSASKSRQKSASSSRKRKKKVHSTSSDVTLVSQIANDQQSAESSSENCSDIQHKWFDEVDSSSLDAVYEHPLDKERFSVDSSGAVSPCGTPARVNSKIQPSNDSPSLSVGEYLENDNVRLENGDASNFAENSIPDDFKDNGLTKTDVKECSENLDEILNNTEDTFTAESLSENVTTLNSVKSHSDNNKNECSENLDEILNISEDTFTAESLSGNVSTLNCSVKSLSDNNRNTESFIENNNNVEFVLDSTRVEGLDGINTLPKRGTEDQCNEESLLQNSITDLNVANHLVTTDNLNVESLKIDGSPESFSQNAKEDNGKVTLSNGATHLVSESSTSTIQLEASSCNGERQVTSDCSKIENAETIIHSENQAPDNVEDVSIFVKNVADEDCKTEETPQFYGHVAVRDNFEVPRSSSSEQSELSGTESVLNESKHEFQKTLSRNMTIDVSQSCLDIGKRVEVKGFQRCSSFPKSLKDVESKVFSDKGTFTTDFACCNCGSLDGKFQERTEGSSSDLEGVAPLHKSTGVSAELGGDKSRNALPPLTIAHARARSYVFGNSGHTGSLLGSEELNRFFPEGQVTIFVGTWNMNSHDPPRNIDDFLLPLDIHSLPDIYVIGVQEAMQSRLEWEILLQSTLGPSHVLLASSSLGVLHLSVFVRRDLVWFCSEPEDASVATRPGTMVKTKGAVAVSFMLFGTSFLFVNSHLAAHEQKLKERLLDYEKICTSLELPKSTSLKAHQREKDVTSRFDCVLWCGDLNFRVMRDRPSVLSFVEQRVCKSRPSCSFLVKHDQLFKAMQEGSAFCGFEEGVIHFNPSYKFEVGTNTFNSTKQRVPSYTDRILYRSRERSTVTCLHYDAVPDILTSDHKPVFGVFKVNLRPGRDNVPLAAGLFKRDIYLEAIRRRSQFLGVPQGQSTICSIM